jgi:hypothetical protein
MRTVIYDLDLEPITAIEVPLDVLEQLESQGAVRIPVRGTAAMPNTEILLVCKKIRWIDDRVKTLVITDSVELALALKPCWLPGQLSMVNDYKKRIQLLEKLNQRK